MIDLEVQIPKKVYLPCYQHLLDSDADINFLWGGRDSGKSHFIAQKLIEKCMTADYFRCILVKKTFNSIHDAQWQTIKDIVNQWGLSSLFQFKESPLSIECVNGNKFLARGCDDPANLKSIKDPSDVWYEELNQLTLNDFVTVATTLRSDKAKVQQWCSFNPETEGPYDEFWLYKYFFKGRDYNFTDKWVIQLPNNDPIEFIYTSTHTTYHDNKHVTNERIALLEWLADSDPYYYTVFAEGVWGNIKAGSPFIFNFNKKKHIKKGLEAIPHLPIILSFDFNTEPITCLVGQCDGLHEVRILDEYRLINSDIEELCTRIISDYQDRMLLVTGDASGQNRTALKRDLNYYKEIKRVLQLGMGNFKIPAGNPRVKNTRVLCNALLKKHTNYFFSDRVPFLVLDIDMCEVDEKGGIDKKKDKHKSHLLDAWRYFNYTFLHKFLDRKYYEPGYEETNIQGDRDQANGDEPGG